MIKKLMTLGVIFVFTPMAFGQQGSAVKQLTLQDCINIALHRNTSVLQSEFQSESQGAKLLTAYGALLPSVSADGEFSYQYNQIKSGVQVGGVIIPLTATSISRRYTAGIGANYTLFDGMANFAGLNMVRSQSASAKLGFDRAKQTAVYQTIQNYLAVFNARDQLKISENNLKRDQGQLDQIKESNSVGSASLADVYQQQAVVSGDEYSLVQAKNAYEQAQANLKYFLSIPVSDDVQFADPSVSSTIDTTQFSELNGKYSDVPVLVQRALEARPDYKAALENVNASKSQVAIANAAYSPTISAFANYGINGPGTSTISQNKSFYGGLQLTLPIFNGFQTQTNIQVADVNLKAARQTLDATKQQVQLDIYKALLNLYSAEKGYESAVNALVYAKINLETAQEKYKVGSGTLLDVLTANALYTQDESNQVVAAYTYIQAKMQVEYATGTIKY
jgi:outer membrane protein